MEHRQLLNFLSICEEKNFTKASKKRYITQQGISKSIKELEEELEVPLFFRTRQGIELTEFGSALEIAAKSYIDQHNYIIDTMRRLKEKTKSYISIGIINGINDTLPIHFFKTFLDSYQDISFNMMSFTDDECQKAIIDHRLQLGLCPEPIDSNNFESILSIKRNIALITGRKHRLAAYPSIKMEELKGEEVIILNNNKFILELCARNGIKSVIHLKSSETSLIYDLCSTNRIVSFWASSIYRFPGLSHTQIEDIDLYRVYHLIANRHAHISGAAEQFIAYAKEELSKSNHAL